MKRVDLVTVALQGAYGKPCPALVIQSNLIASHPSVPILPITSELRQTPLFRIEVEPTAGNNLKERSQIMVDKAQTVPREEVDAAFGLLDNATMMAVHRALALWLGFA